MLLSAGRWQRGVVVGFRVVLPPHPRPLCPCGGEGGNSLSVSGIGCVVPLRLVTADFAGSAASAAIVVGGICAGVWLSRNSVLRIAQAVAIVSKESVVGRALMFE